MKKIISQISLVLLIITIGMTAVLITEVYGASKASMSVSSATEGGTFTVTLNFPAETVAGGAEITVTFSNGTTETKKIVYAPGQSSNSVQFTAKAAGSTSVSAKNIQIAGPADANGLPTRIETSGTLEQTITIASKTPAPSTTPDPEPTTPPSTDTGKDTTTTPSTDNKDDKDDKEEEKKEPEVKNPSFKEVNETVYALKGCNVRSSCSTEISSNKIGGLVKGQSIKRTGVEGTWSRVVYNGKTAYVATSLLTTEKPKEEEPENKVANNTVENKVTNKVKNEVTKNTVENNTVTDENVISNEQILNQIENEIGVLPEVGNNIATNLFTIISIITLAVIMGLKYKSKE